MQIERSFLGGIKVRGDNGQFIAAPRALLDVALRKERAGIGTIATLVAMTALSVATSLGGKSF